MSVPFGNSIEATVDSQPPKFPTPEKEGHYWAKLNKPVDMPEGEDWSSFDWEVVQVFDNATTGAEKRMASVCGVTPSQPLEAFTWGPEVPQFGGKG